MKHLHLFSIAGIFIIATLLIITGCTNLVAKNDLQQPKDPPAEFRHSIERLISLSPCGALQVKRPGFNITGHIRSAVRPNTSVYLFVTPNISVESSVYVVRNCRPIVKEEISLDGHFRFGPLPLGNYVVMAPGTAFVKSQGFPIVNEFNYSDFTLEIGFHGGNNEHSLVSFSISSVS